MNRPFAIALGVIVGLLLFFSGCTAVVWWSRGSLIKATEAGNQVAHFFILAGNFWARYVFFFIIMAATGLLFAYRIAGGFRR